MARYRLIAMLLAAGLWMASPAWAALFQAGEAGILLQWDPNHQQLANGQVIPAASPVNLTGYTVQMVFRLNTNSSNQVRTCTVAANGMTASYVMTATDFPAGGNYYIEFIATAGSTTVRKSPIINISVGPALQ